MKIKIEIKNRFTGIIIFEHKSENNTVKETILKAIDSGANFSYANFSGADLRGADLRDVNFSCANFSGADLRGANLRGANLRGANLSGADLRGANFSCANLRYANFSCANLRGADLRDVNFSCANLRGADLRDVNFSCANLRYADLRDVNFSCANLRGADLRDVNLRGADLRVIKNDLFLVLLHGVNEIKYLKTSILEGKIDGSTYDGDCSCLSGTMAKCSKGDDLSSILSVRDSSRPIERFFLGIKIGDNPENSHFSKLAFDWICEFEELINRKV